jgi:hypothetical protein
MLARAAEVEQRVTADFTAVVPPDAVMHHLQNRMKSPQSLARKFSKAADSGRVLAPEDLLRYTIVVSDPDDLVDAATGIVRDLRSKGWVMDSAEHSYVDSSRYKGLHTFLRSKGELIELQIHSQESIEVKNRTTPLYEIERDPRQTKQARDTARAACISMSDGLREPAGIAQLDELGGVPVVVRKYGGGQAGPVARPGAGQRSQQEQAGPRRTAVDNSRDGIER